MRRMLQLAALGLVAAAQANAARAADWSGDVSLVSDYRYRGVSLSGEKPALQGSAGFDLKSGFYGELWGSTIKNDGAGRLELDSTAGYALDLQGSVSLDLSATYYVYPEHGASNALETTIAIEATDGPLTGRLGASVTPPQKGTRDDEGRRRTNLYLFADASYAIPDTRVSLKSSLGLEQGPWDMRDHGAKWDYSLGLEADLQHALISLDFVGTNAGADGLVGALSLRF